MSVAKPFSISKLDAISFDALLRGQEILASRTPCFDLRSVRFITPAGLVQLAATCYALHREGRAATITLSGESVPIYLLRSNFIRVVSPVARFNPAIRSQFLGAFEARQGASPFLIELTKIDSESDLPELLKRIITVLQHQLGYAKEDAYDIAVAISESIQNTFEHNRVPETFAFLAMQVYGRDTNPFLEIGMADIGAGVATTLRGNAHHAHITSDLEAVMHATQPLVSRYADPTHGTGLFHLVETTYKHRGTVQIRSGAGTVRYRTERKQGWGFHVPSLPGVQIALTLPSKAPSS